MGIFYWMLVWIFMIGAFMGAWSFIVKGCEALDDAQPPEEEAGTSPGASH